MTPVGAINLVVRIKDDIKQQLQKLQSSASAPAKELEKTISKPLEQARVGISGIKKELQSLQQEASKGVKWKQYDAAQIQKEMDASVPAQKQDTPDLSEVFEASSDPAELLRQKLVNINQQILDTRSKLAQMTAEFNAIGDKDVGGEQWTKLSSQITQSEAKLISLQSSANSTKKSLNGLTKPVSAPSAPDFSAMENNAKKSTGRVRGLFSKMGSGIKNAAGGAGKNMKSSLGKSVKDIQSKVGGLSKSVKSAFKSAFLMAGLYSAFKGMKTLLTNVTKQNDQFRLSLNQIKANLTVAFTPIIQAVMPMLNTLMSGLAAASKSIATFTAGVFGQTYDQAVESTKKMKGIVQGTVSGMDELQTLDTNKTDFSSLDKQTEQAQNAANLTKTLLAQAKGFADGMGKLIATGLQKLAEMAPGVITVAVSFISSFVSAINNNWPAIQSAVLQGIKAFTDGIEQLMPVITPLAVNIVTLLIEGFLTMVPSLIASGITLLAGLLQGLAEKMPELVPMALEGINTIVNALMENLPLILQSGIDILVALILGIAQALPTLIPAAVEAILTIVRALVDNLPQLIDAALQIIIALADGLIASLPALLEQAPVILHRLIDAIVEALPMLIDAAIEIIMSLVDFVLDNMDMIISCGIDIMMTLATGLVGAIPKLVAKVPEIIRAFVDKIMHTDWLKVGKDILSGIWDGIKSGAKGLLGGIGNLFGGLFGGGSNSGDVQKFATGGIVSAPTLAMVGEYNGAKSNPEIIAPLNKLQALMGAQQDPRVVELLSVILETLQGLDLRLTIGDETLGRHAANGINSITMRTGINPIVI